MAIYQSIDENSSFPSHIEYTDTENIARASQLHIDPLIHDIVDKESVFNPPLESPIYRAFSGPEIDFDCIQQLECVDLQYIVGNPIIIDDQTTLVLQKMVFLNFNNVYHFLFSILSKIRFKWGISPQKIQSTYNIRLNTLNFEHTVFDNIVFYFDNTLYFAPLFRIIFVSFFILGLVFSILSFLSESSCQNSRGIENTTNPDFCSLSTSHFVYDIISIIFFAFSFGLLFYSLHGLNQTLKRFYSELEAACPSPNPSNLLLPNQIAYKLFQRANLSYRSLFFCWYTVSKQSPEKIQTTRSYFSWWLDSARPFPLFPLSPFIISAILILIVLILISAGRMIL